MEKTLPITNEKFDYLTLSERFKLAESVLLICSLEDANYAKELAAGLKKEGIKVLTRDEIDFHQITSTDDQKRLRSDLGGIFIIPSDSLMKADSDLVSFLYQANSELPDGEVAHSIFMLTDHRQVRYLEPLETRLGHSITALSLVGDTDYDSSAKVRIAGKDATPRFLKFFKQQRLKKR
ncbi:hypothetical protein A3K29_02510 [Candidatus Collierbacteria bacterium RIFOXYB2_FULL_46_14]|uniref:Uncharacterized protein n=1 Tax=Candidatus Collierbacteria bacterium GW2011_GWA2_46_26 TaxID=1618381 RepID=A0A0G1PMG2_9BACT|nr:MAG: hypothetical protein UW29_C0004G0007 [Candidatus Collierbacteria bacterium GW2011_GWC2_44_13]KKU33941.1 MAG: hypothetical protein UX47_C0001G0224 [Candidatus Collierbacteria bacterium GW2011_GWA2_46_26]OGD72992.1 MAG: hypothetical protein A3K29_02510 [Candidatus Collierbacteria bacterium RIFOXYB2_FULL_46_14]OGD76034.1 MAG: hypothetical protein A3K43_02510 [Candidatus Collierbacteria bacterium RIFOXYA2_FULL_46_20]OGD77370.1 MAG: hypothetical protein A3K39_02510 [Candidatus Collierbacteri